MRNVVSACLINLFEVKPFVFLTGDLGYNALEALRDVMGNSFINAGISEQNMMSVAAGLACQGMDAWTYSIAPFCYARPFEQIRNDICLHNFPVKIIGNGGGYGYGSMGSSHHALEDYGALLTLQGMRAYVPSFSTDLLPLINHLSSVDHPAYLRLGLCEKPDGFEAPPYAPWRKMLDGTGPVLLAIGPLVGGIIGALQERSCMERPIIWSISELPIEAESIPDGFVDDLAHTEKLCVVEEHVRQGGLGQMLAHQLARRGVRIARFEHLYALGYPSGTYGSQTFHRKECGIDSESVLKIVDCM